MILIRPKNSTFFNVLKMETLLQKKKKISNNCNNFLLIFNRDNVKTFANMHRFFNITIKYQENVNDIHN